MLTAPTDSERLFTTHEVAALAGASFRQVDYWDRCGYIVPSIPARGSGSRRRWTQHEALIIAVFARLLAANVPSGMFGAVRDRLEADPNVNVVEIQTDDKAIAITVDVFTIRNDLDAALAC